jgi:hypothetical protein
VASPFGGHPTFGRYLMWAAEQGCQAQSGFRMDSRGQTHTLTKITAPSGKSVVVPGVSQTEYLVPTMISYLDRRLGLSSPWFSLPDGGEQDQGGDSGEDQKPC